ncbi:MAG: PfkB family carbohydrate kinase [Anaerolinea sp.]|nr:PfkB family carbohydrate kinase [Anaerolinea sp.]
MKAACVGDNCIDRYLPPLNRTFVGGNAVNVAVYLRRSGIPTAYVGVVGDDGDGRRVLDALAQQDIDTTRVQILPGQTAYSDIRLNAANEREFVAEYLGPKPSDFLTPALIDFIGQHDLVHLTMLGGTEADLPHIRRACRGLLSLDYGERSTADFVANTLPLIDLAFFSLPEDRFDEAHELAQRMAASGPRLVVVTGGARGSIAYDGQWHFAPAQPVTVVDSLGAGDAYIGSLLAHYLRSQAVLDCMQQASAAAALACTHYGAWLQP